MPEGGVLGEWWMNGGKRGQDDLESGAESSKRKWERLSSVLIILTFSNNHNV